MEAPPIQYARTSDGVSIAYWTLGEGPPVLMVHVPAMSHLQREWEVPTLRKFYEGLACRFQLIRYNPRNAGLSDRNVEHRRLEDYVKDVEAVVGTCTDGAVAILAYLAAAPAIQYAADFPEQVNGLVIVDGRGTSPGSDMEVYSAVAAASNEMLVESIVNMVDPARSDFASLLRLVRDAVDADDRPRNVRAVENWDVTGVLSAVTAPALIIYSPRAAFDFDRMSREMASRMPNSRLVVRRFERVALADSLSDEVVSLVSDFVDEVGGSSSADGAADSRVPSDFRTLLFTDLESSTALTQSLGDAKAQEVLHGHNAAVRSALTAHGGEEVKHTGDGIFAAFGSAVGAVEAALQIQRELAGGEVRVRVGLNAGEPIAEDDDYFGTAVQLASRVCDRAEPGQVLVSNVVRELCAGKGFTFADQGEATLKGFGEPVRLFAVGEGA